jgi:cytochrome d ubiquinol oxidase subunit I
VVVAGVLGAMMVISVNGWMNHPAGFRLDRHGGVTDVRPFAALFGNSYFWHELVHMYVAAFMVTGFLLAAAYAIGRLRGRWDRYHRTAFAIPLTAAVLASPIQVLVGDWAARDVATHQPVKLAAIEGLATTTRGAPEHLLGYYTGGHVEYGIEIPHLLSLLAFHDPNAEVRGLDSVPVSDRPPVNVVRFAFQTMVGIGTLLALLAVVYLVVVWRRRRLPITRWFYRAVVIAGPAAYVALVAGWVTTEVGRQPWVVYGVMRTDQAVTGARGLPVGYLALALAYLMLAAGTTWALVRLARAPLAIDIQPQPRSAPRPVPARGASA